MSAPEIPSFGATIVGKKFTWIDTDDDGNQTEHTFRARSSISFDDYLEYRAMLAELQLSGQLLIRNLKKRGAELDTDEGQERDVDEVRGVLEELSKEAIQNEHDRWQIILNQTALLVTDRDREAFRELIGRGNMTAVTALREWLITEVIGRSEVQAEVMANVDPTLPPPQPDSPASHPGGPDSEPEASSSTD